jgi:uncharacterized surface protein with fasciclin (FAS1) repeats
MKKLWAVLSMVVVLALATTGMTFASRPPQEGNIVDVAIAVNAQTGDFDTLIAAVTCPAFNGSLVRLLQSKRVTVFAPTDAAFERLELNPDNVCKKLDPVTLKTVLFYHIAPGIYDSTAVVGMTQIMMLNKLYAPVTVMDGSVYVDEGKVIIPDVMASNGYIHVVDAVLLP